MSTQQSNVSAYTKYNRQLIKRLLLKMDLYSLKHVEHILKIKSNHKNFVHLVGYKHIVRTVVLKWVCKRGGHCEY